ncbi:MAG: 4'-phosphopantetheinyl transferase superfamily protein [Eubacteriales bacterium]|nr:4'-phosphopantetheinyl transferase superfamily protein [Eubacteriales bacterium]
MILGSAALAGRSGHEAGRRLLAELYAREVGGPLPEIALSPGGKPFFVDSPWHFSISHTKRHVFCALSRTPVGIDAEELDRNISLNLADKILSPGEKAQFDAAPDKRKALLTFWVLKEAAVKHTGQGLRGYPSDTDFDLNDPRVSTHHGCLVAVIESPL